MGTKYVGKVEKKGLNRQEDPPKAAFRLIYICKSRVVPLCSVAQQIAAQIILAPRAIMVDESGKNMPIDNCHIELQFVQVEHVYHRFST